MPRTTAQSLLDQVKQLPPREAEQFAVDYAQWRVASASDEQLIRDHAAFLSGYAAEDEVAYDGEPGR
jgi:hypothetical protein